MICSAQRAQAVASVHMSPKQCLVAEIGLILGHQRPRAGCSTSHARIALSAWQGYGIAQHNTSNSSSTQRRSVTAAAFSSKPGNVLQRLLGPASSVIKAEAARKSDASTAVATWPVAGAVGAAVSSSSTTAGAAAGPRLGIINPNNSLYRAWWGLLIGAAAFTGIFVPWEWGFGDWAHMYSLSNPANWVDLGLVLLFLADMGVSHFVAYETDEMLVDEPGAIAANYRRQRLALDVLSAIPFDWIAYTAATVLASSAVFTPEASDPTATAAAATALAGAAAAAGAGAGGVATELLTSAANIVPEAAVAAAAATDAAMATGGSPHNLIPAIASLKGLHLVRLYRVQWFFRYLEYDLTVSLLTVTVARNLVIVLYLTHWVACGFNFLARSEGYDPDLLVGLNSQLFSSSSQLEQYLYSLYWAVTTLAGNEWNGTDAVTDMRQVEANTIRASVFLLFNIALGAYILGTITLLVVKNDERTGRYRDLSSNLKTYTTLNQLPAELKDEMQEHLKLKFNNQEASDDQVLSIYPTTIRRRILRHLYLRHLRASYLFRGTPRKYLDALLAASRLELFRPGVDLLAAGDAVNELFVVVAGRIELRSPLDPSVSQYDWGGEFDDLSFSSLDPLSSMMGELDPDSNPGVKAGNGMSVYMGPHKVLGPGELFGEISFFTEIPQMETVRSLTTVRVMVISRGAFESIERNFPIASRLVLENLKRRSEAQVAVEFPGIGSNRADLQQLLSSCPSSLMYSWASPELVELTMSKGQANNDDSRVIPGSSGSGSSTDSSFDFPDSAAAAAAATTTGGSGGLDVSSFVVTGSNGLANGLGSSFTARQELVLSNLVRVLAVINQHVAKQEEDRTTDFLYAATRGDTVKLRAMLQQGFNPDSADYDGRTALMLACVWGHKDVVDLLLAAGADPTLDDNLGRSALLEACYNGHDGIIDTLTFAGVRLAPQAANKAAGSSSSNGGSSGSARMSTSGSVRSNISGSNTINRFGPAAIIGSQDLAAAGSYGSMTPSGDQLSAGSSKNASWALQLASLLCNCVYECNLPLLRRLLRAGAPVNLGDYDRRTALHISAAEGNNVMVRVLVEEGGADLLVRDRWGHTPLEEARRVGATPVIRYLEAAVEAEAAATVTAAAVAQQQQQQRQEQDMAYVEKVAGIADPARILQGGTEYQFQADASSCSDVTAMLKRQQDQIKQLQERHAQELQQQQKLLQGKQVRAQVDNWRQQGQSSQQQPGTGNEICGGAGESSWPAKLQQQQEQKQQMQQRAQALGQLLQQAQTDLSQQQDSRKPVSQQQQQLEQGGNSSSSNGNSSSNVVPASKLQSGAAGQQQQKAVQAVPKRSDL